MITYIPNKYGDDGEITQEWLDYDYAIENAETIADEWYRSKRDDEISDDDWRY